MSSGRVGRPDEPAQAANVLPVSRAEAADKFVSGWDLRLPPLSFVWEVVTDRREFVPLLVEHILALVIDDSQTVDHSRARVLVDLNLANATRRVNRIALLLVLRGALALQAGSFRSQQRTL